jgi:DnaD/phage-associated family protein
MEWNGMEWKEKGMEASSPTISNALQNLLGDTSPLHFETACSYLNDGIEEAVIVEAIQRAHNKRKNWDYAKGIIANWLNRSIKTLDAVKQEDTDFAERSGGGGTNRQSAGAGSALSSRESAELAEAVARSASKWDSGIDVT